MATDPMLGKLVPACGGAEQPFTVKGRRWLYCWHPSSGRHAYLDVDNDRVVWNRCFHPVTAPHLEFEEEAMIPPRPAPRVEPEPDPFYW